MLISIVVVPLYKSFFPQHLCYHLLFVFVVVIFSPLLSLSLQTRAFYLAQASPQIATIFPLPLECWDYRYV